MLIPSNWITSKICPGFLVDSLTRQSEFGPMIQTPDSDKTCKFTTEISVLDGVIIEPDKTLGCADWSSIILSLVPMEIKFSEILVVFSIIVFTLETTYPPSSFYSANVCFPGIDALGLPSPVVCSDSEFLSETTEKSAVFFRPP